MGPLSKHVDKTVERLARPSHDDLDRVAEKAIIDFFCAQGVEPIEAHGSVFACGQFWTTNRARQRLITSRHIDLTALAEAVVTQIQLAQRGMERQGGARQGGATPG